MGYDIDSLLRETIAKKASDIHLTVGSPPVFRIDGELIPEGENILDAAQMEQMAHFLIGDHWGKFQDEGELDFAYEIEDVGRFRINTFKQKGNISIAARSISSTIPTIEELEMPAILNELALKPQGLILVTGPTGSGKSTTLAAMIDYVNRNTKKHIITLEDPIE